MSGDLICLVGSPTFDYLYKYRRSAESSNGAHGAVFPPLEFTISAHFDVYCGDAEAGFVFVYLGHEKGIQREAVSLEEFLRDREKVAKFTFKTQPKQEALDDFLLKWQGVNPNYQLNRKNAHHFADAFVAFHCGEVVSRPPVQMEAMYGSAAIFGVLMGAAYYLTATMIARSSRRW